MKIITYLKNLVTSNFHKVEKENIEMITPTITTVDVMFRRVTNRYHHKGTMSHNKGYLKVGRDEVTGRFVSLKQK